MLDCLRCLCQVCSFYFECLFSSSEHFVASQIPGPPIKMALATVWAKPQLSSGRPACVVTSSRFPARRALHTRARAATGTPGRSRKRNTTLLEEPSDAEVVPISSPLAQPSAGSERFKDARVLVAGSTGGVGRRVVQRLAREGASVKALVRDFAKGYRELPGPEMGVTLHQGDVYQYNTLPQPLANCNMVICATGAKGGLLQPLAPYNVDYQGTVNLIAAAKAAGVKKFVLVTSIGTDDPLFPLNLFWGILFWKKRAEEELQRSGLDYTIIRPGGLQDQVRDGQREGGIIMTGPNTFGLPPKRRPGSILRSQVADLCVEALVEEAASNKVVEVIAEQGELPRPASELYSMVL